jgi:hypothetical protein
MAIKPKKEKTAPAKPAKGKVGKPAINNPDDSDAIKAKIDAYFDECEDCEHRPTYCGLAYHLGYASRQSIWENAHSDSNISLPLKRALLRIEEIYERMLGSNSCTGAIFALKNRGWTDKQLVEHTGEDGGPLEVSIIKRVIVDS